MLFIFILFHSSYLFSFFRYFHFCAGFGCVEKRLDKKANFKNCDVTDWTTNNYSNRLYVKTILNKIFVLNRTLVTVPNKELL